MSVLSVIVFILIFGLVVLVHELGHFWAARRAKVGVDEFGFGLPPRMWGVKRGETIYSINWIPFGGFVKLVGEGVEGEADRGKSLREKGFWARFLVIVAGVVMNFILAYVLIAVGFWFGMPPLTADPAGLVMDPSNIHETVRVNDVEKESPADKQGLKPGDFIVKVNDVTIEKVTQLQALVASVSGSSKLEVLRDGATLNVEIAPLKRDGKMILGVYAQEVVDKVRYVWWQVPVLAARDFAESVVGVGRGMIAFFGGLFTTGKLAADVTGPLGIAQITAQAVRVGLLAVIQFTIMLSINLGFVNILPFPALDGGRLLMLLIESVTPKKRWNLQAESWVNSAGFVLLLILIALVTYKDIVRIF